MQKIFLAAALCLTIIAPAFAQNPVANAKVIDAKKIDAKTLEPKKIDDDFIHRQFGDQFTFMPSVGVAYGDLDGDGVEDVVIAARCKNPMLDQGDHDYTVIDPYDAFFGYGNPQVTTTFSSGDPGLRGLVMLIIHGAGPDAWRSSTPKAKFVVVNLPFRTLSVRKFKLKKKTVEAVYVEEAGEISATSAVFFDGKKFQYVPMGGDME
ncbi:MAG: hypothetical protein WBV46_00515 [Terriglobales bacterium]